MNRARGWIQDSGKLESLFNVVDIFNKKSSSYINLRKIIIKEKIENADDVKILIKELSNNKGYLNNPLISHRALVGTRTKPNEVNSIIQCLIPGQSKRIGIVDWACDNFIRLSYTLDFISYDDKKDSYTITDLGLKLSNCKKNQQKYDILKDAFRSYPPIVRILELLYNQYLENSIDPSLTKFELGKELGFKGEDGFTTYSQNLFIHALNNADKTEKKKIRQNWEGSSDKYSRMICGWLLNSEINWIEKRKKNIEIKIGTESFASTLGSFQITCDGINAFRSCRAYSKNLGSNKKVFFEMLATKCADKEFLRLRRTYILKTIKQPKKISQIIDSLDKNNLKNITKETIIDDINNLKRIGLDISFKNDKYKLRDSIELLEIPNDLKNKIITPTILEEKKQILREELTHLKHEYLDLLDLSIGGKPSSILFEIRIVELLNEIIVAKHLAGGNRPEIVAYYPSLNPINSIIIDSKAYSKGFSIPATERDKMIRYIDEYNRKDKNLNSNAWWEKYQAPDYPKAAIIYSFVSSLFVGQYVKQLEYINRKTKADGNAIKIETLLTKVNNVLSSKIRYNTTQFFSDLSCNKEVE